jgi:methionyl-tRNA formyltransferase
MRAAFVTCVQLGLSCMEEIYAVGGHLDLVLTLPDEKARRKSGRVYVDRFCSERGIPLRKVNHINDAEAIEAIREHDIDWLCIIGWSQIAGEAVLQAPRLGALGMHPTLLPEGRGRAAIPWAILKGLSRTGVTLFRLTSGVDTGPIGAQVELPIAPDETATTLYERVNEAHRTLIRQAWPELVAGRLEFRPQDESRATYWPGRSPADGRITPEMSLVEIDRLVRATTHPYPGAFLEKAGKVLRIWAGRPGLQGEIAVGAVRIEGRDGVYEALDYEWEPSAP